MKKSVWLLLAAAGPASCGVHALAQQSAGQSCTRPLPGSPLPEPADLHSVHGVLRVDLAVRNEVGADGRVRYCYLAGTSQAPTLHLNPGDLLILALTNRLTPPPSDPARIGGNGTAMTLHLHPAAAPGHPCSSGAMGGTSTNLHFHGLSIAPSCHQDDVLRTSIQPADAPFEYRFRIPAAQPAGLYWYHPHIHGFSSRQVGGGASGALIVEGIERSNPEVAGLPQRVLVIRDQDLLYPQAVGSEAAQTVRAQIDRDGDALNTATGSGRPARDLSVNYVPVPWPDYPAAIVVMRPGERQLWRVLNATSVTYLNIAALYKRGARFRPQWLGVVAIDGVPLGGAGTPGHRTEWRDGVVLSPGARVEFMLDAPPADVPAMLVTRSVNTGESGENDPDRPLLTILTAANAPEPRERLPALAAGASAPPQSRPWLGAVAPTRVRHLYFSEDPPDPADPASTGRFYLTVEGQRPTTFDPHSHEPNIVVHQGDVEDWIIENRSTELHDFHIHQVHFQVIEWLGLPLNEPFLRDTVNIPYYDSSMTRYPSVRLRLDFRDPSSVGTFLYHCHLLDHEDGGMMGMIQVLPARGKADNRAGFTRP